MSIGKCEYPLPSVTKDGANKISATSDQATPGEFLERLAVLPGYCIRYPGGGLIPAAFEVGERSAA